MTLTHLAPVTSVLITPQNPLIVRAPTPIYEGVNIGTNGELTAFVQLNSIDRSSAGQYEQSNLGPIIQAVSTEPTPDGVTAVIACQTRTSEVHITAAGQTSIWPFFVVICRFQEDQQRGLPLPTRCPALGKSL